MTPITPIPPIKTPVPLMLRRIRYQLLPIVTFAISASLAGWIWANKAHSAMGTGEVEAVRVILDSKFDGVLVELPKPISVFDSVRSGQLVARMDTGVVEAELQKLETEFTQMPGASTTATTAPAIASPSPAVDWYRTHIEKLRRQLSDCDVKSPISGRVVDIHKRPGEGVSQGKPILTIAADHPTCIIGYLRQDQHVQPVPGMNVQVAVRGAGGARFTTTVQTVGAQVEQLPPRHWGNPTVPEWGLPIRIAIPTDVNLRPGELVDLVLRPN